MPDYEKVYHDLFNAITDALDALEYGGLTGKADADPRTAKGRGSIYLPGISNAEGHSHAVHVSSFKTAPHTPGSRFA